MKGNNKFISKILFKLLLLRGGCSDYTMMKAIQKDKIEVVKLLLPFIIVNLLFIYCLYNLCLLYSLINS